MACGVSTQSSDLLPLEGAKSGVWSYFGFPAKEGKFVESDKKKRTSAHCKLCPKELKYTGNTTNLCFHLESSHRAAFQDLQAKAKQNDALTSQVRAAAGQQQQSIAAALQGLAPLQRSSPRLNRLTEAVCYFVAKDMQPMDTVNDTGFFKMISEFEPRYTPPDRKTIATHYLPQMMRQRRSAFGKLWDLLSTMLLQLTCGHQGQSTLTQGSLSTASVKISACRATFKEFADNHTASNITEELKFILQEWNLPLSRLSAVTTDNCANIVLAAEILEWQRMPCFSHTLQL